MIASKRNYKIFRTNEFVSWFEKETERSQVQINSRLFNIEIEGHFGNKKFLGDNIWELKWINGRRIYYAYFADLDILLLLGGNKNGQDKDIKKSRTIYRRYTES